MFAHRTIQILTTLLFLLFYISIFPSQQSTVFADTSQNVDVSLKIPSSPRDYQFAFSSVNNANTVHQDDTLSYQIVYGAKKTAEQTTKIVLVADFSHDTALGGDLLEY
ncbi:MAG TPA: hypothetical protein VLG12_06480, partial [Candidatus Saccharimonadales bacterium]|nr:hypothetical protein [Candidatus Saccharimonadales bacterium]